MTPKELKELEAKYNVYEYTQAAKQVLRLIRDYRELEKTYKALYEAYTEEVRKTRGKRNDTATKVPDTGKRGNKQRNNRPA